MRTILTRLSGSYRFGALLGAGLLAGTIGATSWSNAEEPTGQGKAVPKVKKRAELPAVKKGLPAVKKAIGQRLAGQDKAGQPADQVNSSEAKRTEPKPIIANATGNPAESKAVAAEIDRLIEQQLAESKVEPAGLVNDEDFLRRVHFDIAGTLPTAKEVTLFGLDPDPNKRAKVVEQLLDTDEYDLNWARYWRDVLFLRATNERARIMARTFEEWMVKQLHANAGWDDITRALITGQGDISEHGEAALIFIHEANPEEIAGEVSRIFLGIQMQCANCHDHPTDKWTRDQFHALAAFFPRITLRREPDNPIGFTVASFEGGRGPGRFGGGPFQDDPERTFAFADRNRDGKLTKDELGDSPLARVFDRLLENADKNRDGALTLQEIKEMPPPPMQPGRGKSEHHMPDLQQPNAEGKLMTPALFTTNVKGRVGMDDEDRRELLGKWITSPNSTWFAKALVNRLWGELLGEGFFMPLDDMGPERKPRMSAALDDLAAEFVKHDHDLKWLLRTITTTNAYQRQIRYNEPTENPVPFASAIPVRLRSDQIFNAIVKVLGIDEGPRGFEPPFGRGGRRSLRGQFEEKFGYDPSTPQEELLGNVPQALTLMNFPIVTNALRAEGNTRLGQILANNKDDADAIAELYLSFLARDPSQKELTIAAEHLAKVGNRREAFEDLAWSLLNSSEFLSKR
jgi:hypothetical protein